MTIPPFDPQAMLPEDEEGLNFLHPEVARAFAVPAEPAEAAPDAEPDAGEMDAPRTTPEETKRVLAALYGDDCPLAKDGQPTDADWVAWPKALWQQRESAMAPILHGVDRRRKFRKGDQWVSASGTGPWKEPPKPRDAARMVVNVFKAALDQRVQIVTEQRPGFRCQPTSHDPDKQRKAEAQQKALEYQYDQSRWDKLIEEAEYWAGTDGVSFPCLYWDADRGPWFEAGAPGEKYQGGDLAYHIYRIEQVRVSANATASQPPYWWVIKETIARAEKAARYHSADAGGSSASSFGQDAGRSTGVDSGRNLSATSSSADPLVGEETSDRYTIYCRPVDPYLSEGLVMVVVDDEVVVPPKPLPWGIVPLFRFTDGSTDPAFYPVPDSEDWISDQQCLNAAVSKFVEGVRRSVDGRLAVLQGKVKTETLLGGMTSLIEVSGAATVQEALQVIPGISVAADVKELIQLAVSNFEKKSGWNDASRGSFGTDTSGRAILAQREVVERAFARCVGAAADAMTDCAKIALHAMRWGYDQPRLVGITGTTRGDLATEITAETFDGIADVTIDPETMTPMPRSLRLYLLDEMLSKQVITLAEYRRRMPFAFLGSIEAPDEDQMARAKVNCQQIREGVPAQQVMAVPEAWIFDEAIHQDVIQRDLLLPPDVDPAIKAEAWQLWTLLANQAAMKKQPPVQTMDPNNPDRRTRGRRRTGRPCASPPDAAAGAECPERRRRPDPALARRVGRRRTPAVTRSNPSLILPSSHRL